MRFRAVLHYFGDDPDCQDDNCIRWTVVAKTKQGYHYAMRGEVIATFHTRTAAQKVADKLNKEK